jgi:predicted extracellular nuclease
VRGHGLATASILLAAACNGAAGPAGDTPIGAIQGAGASSPLEGREQVVTGIVSGDFQDHDDDRSRALGGFYIQSEKPDEDPLSSEGLFVYEGGRRLPDVASGDRVRVAGRVQEHFGETQLVARSVTVVGRGEVRASAIELPARGVTTNSDGDRIADLEAYEGMLVRFPDVLAVTDLYELERFGTLGVASGGRLMQFTNIARPDVEGYARHDSSNAARTILLDDGRREQNPGSISWLTTENGHIVRAGDTVAALVGNLRYARGSGGSGQEGWRVMPVDTPVVRKLNPRPEVPAVAGGLRVASLNVLNYFSTVDTGRPACGPRGRQSCRGADSEAERERQLGKIVTTLAMLDADIVGLVELGNDEGSSLGDIVRALNRRLGEGSYAAVDTGTLGTDAVRQGLLYRPATVASAGPFAVLDGNVDERFDDSRNRPVLAQAFSALSNGAILTVAVTHLKSKGSPCDEAGDPNTGDGQSNCNLTRTRAAEALVDWLATDPAGSGGPDILVIGDLNAYRLEDPLQVFAARGYLNLAARMGERSYTYVYDGQAGTLDYALASPALAAQVVGFAEWHTNADESPLYDYNLEHGRDPGLFDPAMPFRASDHDPLLVGLDLEGGRHR